MAQVVHEAMTLLDNLSNDEKIRLLRDYGIDVNSFNRVRSWLKDQLPRPQGHWEVMETTRDNGTRYKCSVCGGEVLCFNQPKYCEHCGSKMWE